MLWAPGVFAFFLQEKTLHVHKIPRFGGGEVFWFFFWGFGGVLILAHKIPRFWGGGEYFFLGGFGGVPIFSFMGAGIFLIIFPYLTRGVNRLSLAILIARKSCILGPLQSHDFGGGAIATAAVNRRESRGFGALRFSAGLTCFDPLVLPLRFSGLPRNGQWAHNCWQLQKRASRHRSGRHSQSSPCALDAHGLVSEAPPARSGEWLAQRPSRDTFHIAQYL